MKTYAKKNKSKPSLIDTSDKKSKSSNQMADLIDNRSETVTQMKLKKIVDNSPQINKATRLQSMVDKFPGFSLAPKSEPVQKKESKSSLPDNLKAGMESISGYSMDDVKVHYNSEKPAQLQAHAYAQGTDIHLGAGQEKHLPHEAWHVVQQKQGRVKPTTQVNGNVNVNDNSSLEKEADVMGAKSLQLKTDDHIQLKAIDSNSSEVVQMAKPKSKAAAKTLTSSNLTRNYEEGKIQHSPHGGKELNRMLWYNYDKDAYKLTNVWEFDVYVIDNDYNRGPERIVVGYSKRLGEDRYWYTANHYRTFTELY